MIDQFVVDAVYLVTQHCQMFTHHHTTHIEEVVKPHHQAHGFDDDSLNSF
jgi:hypothetical protein